MLGRNYCSRSYNLRLWFFVATHRREHNDRIIAHAFIRHPCTASVWSLYQNSWWCTGGRQRRPVSRHNGCSQREEWWWRVVFSQRDPSRMCLMPFVQYWSLQTEMSLDATSQSSVIWSAQTQSKSSGERRAIFCIRCLRAIHSWRRSLLQTMACLPENPQNQQTYSGTPGRFYFLSWHVYGSLIITWGWAFYRCCSSQNKKRRRWYDDIKSIPQTVSWAPS